MSAQGYLPASIAEIVGSDALDGAHFEYPVAVWGGGKSMTDVMAFTPAGVIAVEGKAREPFDCVAGEWVDAGESGRSRQNREKAVAKYAAALRVSPDDLLDLRYQLLHRTLSAAITARVSAAEEAWMIVQSFAPRDCDEGKRNRQDFDSYVSAVGVVPTLGGIPVRLAWAHEASHGG